MTVIAWDGHSLAADRRGVADCHTYTIEKVARVGDVLVGVSGYAPRIAEFREWIRSGRQHEKYPKRDDSRSFTALVISQTESGVLIERFEDGPYPIVVQDAQHAIGSGRDYARAAMHLGHSAREAVEVASVFDENCGNGIDVIGFGE